MGGQVVLIDVSDELAAYHEVSLAAAAAVLRGYSTSFSIATRLLRPGTRRDIEALYAMVRVADEIVDGAAQRAGAEPRVLLDQYEQAITTAIACPFHPDPIACAFGQMVRANNIEAEHIAAFFSSMRMDTERRVHDRQSYKQYIYGSAEVIGLMCLRVFLKGKPGTQAQQDGARALGSAFQKINFLRDFRDDTQLRGRRYLPGVGELLNEETKHAVLAEIDQELAQATTVVGTLPADARLAVGLATALFRELADTLRAAPVEEIMRRRLRVPAHRKTLLALRLGGARWHR